MMRIRSVIYVNEEMDADIIYIKLEGCLVFFIAVLDLSILVILWLIAVFDNR